MIKLVGVNKYFNRRKSNEIHVINNTSVELEDSGLVTFLGNSGCGKTTLLNAIGGLDKVNSGDIFIDDERLTRRLNCKKDEIRNAYIGYIFQNYNLIEDETVFFNVEVVLRMIGVKDRQEIEERVMFILEKVGIARFRNRPVKALSGGERQRVGIARALVKNPKIIIADEPTGNLDSRNTIEIMNIIKAISRDRLVILVTHEREIAEFYASRIIEIVDGKIVSDKENTHNDELDYRLENKIYLRDLPVHSELQKDNVKIDFYSDKDDEPLNIKVVVKNNNIYLEFPKELREGSQTTDLIDSHYQKISKDIYEDYEFNYTDLAGEQKKLKYTSIFNWGKVLTNGFRKVFSYSVIKKILLLGFVFASGFTMHSVSSITAVTTVTDDKFIELNKNYLTIEEGSVSPEEYRKYAEMPGIDFAVPGSSVIDLVMPLDDYYQSAENAAIVTGSLASWNMPDESTLTAGTIPEDSGQVLIDTMVADRILQQDSVTWIGIKSREQLVGRKLNGNDAGELTVSGICDTGSPCIYADPAIFFDIMCGKNEEAFQSVTELEVRDYHSVMDSGEVTVKKGRLPENDYEVMVPASLDGSTSIGKTIDTKVNGNKLIITGFYTDKRPERETNYVSTNTRNYALLETLNCITVSPSDKQASYSMLQDKGVKVKDYYELDRENYIDGIKDRIFSTVIVSFVILIVSLIEIYLILRSSFLSRIKEVGVLRAIGLKKKDVYKMFIGEIIALTAITAVPTMLIMSYILNAVQNVPYIGELLVMNPAVFGKSFLIIFAANVIFGLLPVFNTMRKTPAAILARNDVN